MKRKECVHPKTVACDGPESTHLHLFDTSSLTAKVLSEVAEDIQVSATFIQPVKKHDLVDTERGTTLSSHYWLEHARKVVLRHWEANCDADICTASVSSLFNPENIFTGQIRDADPTTFLATPADSDIIAVGTAEKKFRNLGDLFVVLQARTHITAAEIFECVRETQEAGRHGKHEQMEPADLIHKVITSLVCAAERASAHRLHRMATALRLSYEEETTDAHVQYVMPFASAENIQMFKMHLPAPRVIRSSHDGLLEMHQWKRCTVSVRNNMRTVYTPSGACKFGVFQRGIDMGTDWASSGINVHISSDDMEGAVVCHSDMHGADSGRWPFVVCPRHMENLRQGESGGFRTLLANLHIARVDKSMLPRADAEGGDVNCDAE
jgi:hypothetical protein